VVVHLNVEVGETELWLLMEMWPWYHTVINRQRMYGFLNNWNYVQEYWNYVEEIRVTVVTFGKQSNINTE